MKSQVIVVDQRVIIMVIVVEIATCYHHRHPQKIKINGLMFDPRTRMCPSFLTHIYGHRYDDGCYDGHRTETLTTASTSSPVLSSMPASLPPSITLAAAVPAPPTTVSPPPAVPTPPPVAAESSSATTATAAAPEEDWESWE
jgi:hypothetical protein